MTNTGNTADRANAATVCVGGTPVLGDMNCSFLTVDFHPYLAPA